MTISIDPKDHWDQLTPIPQPSMLADYGFGGVGISPEWRYLSKPDPESGVGLHVSLHGEPVESFVGGDQRHGVRVSAIGGLGEGIDSIKVLSLGDLNRPARLSALSYLQEQLGALWMELGLELELDPRTIGWGEWEGAPLRSWEKHSYFLKADEVELPSGFAVDPAALKAVAEAIDLQAANFEWDSVAHPMSLGEYVAPMALTAYFDALKGK